MVVDLLTPPAATDPSAPAERSAGRRVLGRVLGRLVRLVLLLAAVAVASFALMSASPVDPVDAYIGADLTAVGPEQRALIEERWGLDDPAPERFVKWAGQVLQGNLGESAVYGQPVADVLRERLGPSLVLMASAWLLSGALGFGLGVLAGSRRGSWVDRTITWWAYTIASAPTFWVGLLLLYVFAVWLQAAPVCCSGPIGVLPEDVTVLQRIQHLVLPALTLSLVGLGPATLHTRQAVVEVLAEDHVTFARALGERPAGVLRLRVLRNAAAPALTLQFASIGELIGGSVLAEQVFRYPGLGQATTQAALRQDVPLLLAIALLTAVLVFVGNAVGDVVLRRVDPRTVPRDTRLPRPDRAAPAEVVR